MTTIYSRRPIATFMAWDSDGLLQGSVWVEQTEDGRWALRATGDVPEIPDAFHLWDDRTAAYVVAQDHVASFEATLRAQDPTRRRRFDVV